MREEMDAHLAQATARLMTRGLSLEAAQLEARREFGNVGVLQEEARDARGARWIESLFGDIRFALRHFSRRPLGTVTIVLILALGIGGHAAVFSVVQAYSTRPAPGVPRDDALVRLRAKERTRDDGRWFLRPFSYPELRDLSAMKDVFTSVAGWEAQDGIAAIGGSEPALARIYFVTDNYFATLGLPLTLGQGLQPSRADERGEVSAIISEAMWREQFGGRADVLGRVMRLNDVSVRIAGVAPPRFSSVTQNAHTPSGGTRVFWLPINARSFLVRTSQGALSNPDSALFHAVARLAPGVSMDRATAALNVANERADAQMTPRRWVVVHDADVVPLRGDTELPVTEDGLIIAAVGGTVALLVLLIACANVSALVVGAGIARRHEIAIRLSLGASRARVVRQLLTETTLLAIFAGALGLLVYSWIVKLIARLNTDVDLAPDLWTIAFTACLALGTGILSGLSPALHATRHGVSDALKDSGAGFTRRSRLQRVFVIAQIVFSQPLLVGLAMLLGVLVGGGEKPMAPGVEQHVLTVGFQIFVTVGSSAEKRIALERFRTRVEQLPGIVDVVPAVPVTLGSELMVHPDDRGSLARASEPVGGTIEGASPGYFRILDIPILRGRELVVGDTNVVVIGDDVARALWGAADPIGRRFQRQSAGRPQSDLVVVGVYDSRFATTRGGAVTRVYVPFKPTLNPQFLIRTAGPAAAAIEPIRAIARQEVPSLPIGRAQSLEQTNEAMRNEAWQAAAAAAGAGLLALLLASIGLYGVVALAVGQRKREIGIRMALGARPRQVVTMLFASGVRLSVIGLLLGVPLSLVALRMLATQARMPETSLAGVGFGIVAVVLVVSSLATWIPARHASTIDPALTLRSE